MRKRCFNSRYKEFHLYGGKGVTICDEWSDFGAFQTWALNSGYSDNLSIDRIDSNGNYEPSNCRWATPLQQSRNTSRSRLFEIDGEVRCLIEWCEIFHIDRHTVSMRLKKGWDIEKAFKHPTPKRPEPLKTGDRFGRFTVIKEVRHLSPDSGKRYQCRCDCGNIREVNASALRNGYSVSCGCYQKEQVSKANYRRFHINSI